MLVRVRASTRRKLRVVGAGVDFPASTWPATTRLSWDERGTATSASAPAAAAAAAPAAAATAAAAAGGIGRVEDMPAAMEQLRRRGRHLGVTARAAAALAAAALAAAALAAAALAAAARRRPLCRTRRRCPRGGRLRRRRRRCPCGGAFPSHSAVPPYSAMNSARVYATPFDEFGSAD